MGEVGAFFSPNYTRLVWAVQADAQNFGERKVSTKEANAEKLLIGLDVVLFQIDKPPESEDFQFQNPKSQIYLI